MRFVYFESPAERAAYPIINTLCIKNKISFEYQKKFGRQGGGYSSREDYLDEKYYDLTEDYSNYEYNEYDDWEDTSWSCELYRADFALEKEKTKLIVEIDGEKYHQNALHESTRDNYFINIGWKILHIPAKKASHSSFIKANILGFFNLS